MLKFLPLLALVLAASAQAADTLVDGVPLPADASTTIQQQWAGAWVGAWGGTFKHILVVESVTEDGHPKVIYATGDNPQRGFKPKWTRFDATVANQNLKIVNGGLSVTYHLTAIGTMNAVYTIGNGHSYATLSKHDLAELTTPGTVVQWTRGQSERLQTDLVEDSKPARLEVVTFRPPGQGPFPLAVLNHGSTGRGTDPTLFTRTWSNPDIAEFLNERGWIVAFPQRRGRGKSDGLYDEGFSTDRAQGYTCDPDRSLAGAERALQDIDAAISALQHRPDVAPAPILIGGQSRGGILSVAYAGRHPEQVAGVINFVGGWVAFGCATPSQINQTLFDYGGAFHKPTLWLYGQGDPFYPIRHSRENFASFLKAGGQGNFLEFEVPGRTGHEVIADAELWQPPLAAYLDANAAIK